MVGDVVWAPFPFTNLEETKIRPVLILADVRERGQPDWIVCEVTSGPVTHDSAIEIRRGDMRSGRLPQRSRVRPNRLTTLDERVFAGLIGRVTDAKQAEVRAAVRALFTP